MTVWLTADWHLSHQRIIELVERPFASVDEMNRTLIERYQDVVGERDTVWFVGDVCMGPIRESLATIGRLKGHKYLVAGNHDRCFEGYGDNPVNKVQLDGWVADYRRAGFELISTGAHIRRNGYGTLVRLMRGVPDTASNHVELCHFPTIGESQPDREDRFADYRPRPLGGVDRRPVTKRWVVCGHVHNAWLTSGRNLNVGVDQWDFAPVAGADVVRLIETREREFGALLDDPATSTVDGPGRTAVNR
jgi:calcineurin-like phosphoesterase family protein